ncbi:MAG: outer membrane lipoprotein carrier protein LolA [Longimicrobiales bacterium]|nr:outer membrane lipoprotein carrier protein LolA [Longimicrobiales bacterium]
MSVAPRLGGRSGLGSVLPGTLLVALVFSLAPSSGPSSIDEPGSARAWIGPTPLAGQAPSGAGGPSPSEEDPSGLLERASERYEGLDAFCAEFEQERVVPLLNQTTRSAGTLCQKRPGYFLMDFSDPEGDRVVADGESLWIYYPSIDEAQVIRTRLGGAGGTFDFHAEFLEDPTRRFDARYLGTETVTGRSTHVITLEPRDPVAYEEATVWLEVDRGLIRKVEIVEENESVRRVVLSDIRVEPGLDASRFSFEPPPGAQVLDRNLPSARR